MGGIILIIKDIQHVETHETRTDGKYPSRIGSTVEFVYKPKINDLLWLSYIADNQGNEKSGIIHASRIQDIEETGNMMIITTSNSVYYLEKDN